MAGNKNFYVPMPQVDAVIKRIETISVANDSTVQDLMSDLLGFSGVLGDMSNKALGNVGSVSINIDIPKAPEFTPPPTPVAFTPSALKFGNRPTLTATGDLPTLDFGGAPTKSFGDAPTPAAEFSVAVPGNVPSVIVPSMPPQPTLGSYNLPELVVPNIAPFVGSAPIYTPTETLSPQFVGGLSTFAEPAAGVAGLALADHQKLLMTRVTAGGTGLPPAVETAIWNRERDRESSIMRSAEEDVLRQDAAQGFYTPTGTAQAKLYKVRADYSNKIISLGRDIAIKQAELELTNVMKALEQLIPIEQEMVKYDLAMRQRAFDTIKFNNDVAVQVYDVTMKGFLAAQEARKIGVSLYQAQIQAYESEVQAYTALLGAERAKIDMNKALVDQYIAQLSVNTMLLDVYKAEVSATVAAGELEGLKVKVFDSQVSAFNAQVQAHVARIQGKAAETQVYAERVKAYQTEMQSYSAQVEAKAKEFDARATQFKLIQDTNRLQLEMYKTEVDANVSKQNAEIGYATVYNQANSTYASSIASFNNIQAQVWGAASQAHISAQTVASQVAKMNLDAVQASKAMSLDASKTAAQTYSQLISSYLNQQHYGVSVGGSASLGASLSEGHSFSGSEDSTS